LKKLEEQSRLEAELESSRRDITLRMQDENEKTRIDKSRKAEVDESDEDAGEEKKQRYFSNLSFRKKKRKTDKSARVVASDSD
jgi:hypothetical protein